VDAELRQNHKQTASAVIRGLFKSTSGTFDLADIRDVMTQLSLAHLYEQAIAGNEMPEARPLLIAQGFDETWETASLTYLGIEARFEGAADSGDIVPAVVTAIDSAGPAASAGLLPGDRIVAYGAQRGNPPILSDEAPKNYRFGLNRIPSGAKSVPLDVERNGQSRSMEIVPVLVPGGRRAQLQWNPERSTGFFQ
jgi:predicted metalloprotease with PDZ domain